MSAVAFENWFSAVLGEIPIRTNSLIVTLFGDAIAPHGGAVLLGSLIDLVAPLDINGRAVRTSVFRLMQEDWLHAVPIGRRSEYSLTPSGSRRFAHAYRRIYDTPQTAWDGRWQLVIVPDNAMSPTQRESLRRELLWDGFGQLGGNIFAHPGVDDRQLHELLAQAGCEQKVLVMHGAMPGAPSATTVTSLAQQCWRLDKLAEDYRSFVARFSPALTWLENGSSREPQHHFLLRTLLIHEFRRVQLRDPQLPDALLAPDWPGHGARALCRALYEKTIALSELYLEETLQTRHGKLPPADKSLFQRFGGLSVDRRPARKIAGDGAPARNRTTT